MIDKVKAETTYISQEIMTENLKNELIKLFVGELNDATTRENVFIFLNKYLQTNHLDLLVKCNEANNPEEIIDNHRLVFQIGDIEYKIHHTGLDFSLA